MFLLLCQHAFQAFNGSLMKSLLIFKQMEILKEALFVIGSVVLMFWVVSYIAKRNLKHCSKAAEMAKNKNPINTYGEHIEQVTEHTITEEIYPSTIY